MAGKLFTLEAEDESCLGFKNPEVYRSKTMNVMGIKICEGKCKKPFKQIFEGQTVCTQCAIAPNRKTFDPISEKIQEDSNPIKPKEESMPEKKICVEPDCQKEYIPTGHCQKRCPECMAKRKANPMKRSKKTIKQLVKVEPKAFNTLKMPEALYLKTDLTKLFDATRTMCDLSGSVTIQAAGMEITFKKIEEVKDAK